MNSPPTAPPAIGAAPPEVDTSSTEFVCIRCGYNLRGLSPDGACPECGAPIAQSLQGDLLEFSSPEYLASLHRGVVVVLTAIAVQILLMATFLIALAAGTGAPLMTLMNLTFTGVAVALVVGWWWLSAADPAMLGTDRGDRSRRVVRFALLALVFAMLLEMAANLSVSAAAVETSAIVAVARIVTVAARIVGYFAQVLYVHWLARRLPNPRVETRARTLLWLGPVLYTLGLLLLGLGPIIALILYWNMLEWVRKDLKGIRFNQAA